MIIQQEKRHNRTTLNRRYQKMLKLRQQGYFDEDQIKLRHPQLYHLYVGMYQKSQQANPQMMLMSQLLSQQLMNLEYRRLLEQHMPQRPQKLQKISEDDLAMSQQNLIDICQIMFLHGQNKDIDYKKIDEEEQSILNTQEEKYFDSQPPSQHSTDTGIEDY